MNAKILYIFLLFGGPRSAGVNSSGAKTIDLPARSRSGEGRQGNPQSLPDIRQAKPWRAGVANFTHSSFKI